MAQEAPIDPKDNPFSRENRITFEPNSIVGNYKIIKLLGQGGFGDVYQVIDLSKKIKYKGPIAMKTEYLTAPKQALNEEVDIISHLDGDCFPKIFYKSETDLIRYCIMPVYGKSVGTVRTERRSLRVSTAIPIWAEMLRVLKLLHEQGFVHCDVKPSNFLLRKDAKNPLCLIDFGLAMRHLDPKTKLPFPQPESYKFVGTKKYASIHVHQHEGVARRDDLLSWFYSLVEILRGKLPWHAIRDRDEMLAAKLATPIETLCAPIPKQCITIYQFLDKIKYEEVPDYNKLFAILNEIKASDLNAPSVTSEFDWLSFYDNINGEIAEEVEEDESEEDSKNKTTSESVTEKPEEQPNSSGCNCCNVC